MPISATLKIGNKRYFIGHNGHPEYAEEILKKAISQNPTTASSFVAAANDIAAEKNWIRILKDKNFTWPQEEYIYVVDLKRRRIVKDIEAVESKAREYLLAKRGIEISLPGVKNTIEITKPGETVRLDDVMTIRILLRQESKAQRRGKSKN